MFNRKYNIAVLCFIFLMVIVPITSSAPPITSVESDKGLSIWATMHTTIKTGEDYEWEVHVSNFTDGQAIVSDMDCYAHLYAKNGNHQAELYDNTASHIFDYSFSFIGSNFTERGEYVIKFNCNTSTIGGGTELNFWVNDYGEMLDDAQASTFNFTMACLMILFILALIGLFMIEGYIGKFVLYWICHILFVIGTFSVWQFNQGYAMGYVGLAGVWKILFYFSTIAIFPMILVSIAWIVYIHAFNEHFQKLIDKGESPETAFAIANKKRGWTSGN